MLVNLAAARGWIKSLRDHLFFRSCGVGNMVGTPWQKGDPQTRPMNDGSFEPECQRLAARISSLGSVNLADRHFWDLRLTPAERNEAMQLLPPGEHQAVAVSVGTKVPVKDWGEENWAGLLARLSSELRESALVLLGAADERARSQRLSQSWAGPAINFCGTTSARVSAAVLERCRIFIGHDSGPMHLASAVGTPTLGLFSWQNPPGQWYPGHRSWKHIKVLYPTLPGGVWNANLMTKRSDSEGIGRLRPEDAFRTAMDLWNDNRTMPASAFSLS
jgi:ADP-heptose:LPS heptosyltransferase